MRTSVRRRHGRCRQRSSRFPTARVVDALISRDRTMWSAPQGDTGVLGQAARGEQGTRGMHSDAGDDVSVGGKFAHDLFGLHIPYVDAVVFAATDDAGMCAVQHLSLIHI